MDKFSVEFTREEANHLLQLLDYAVQAKGLQVAEAAVYFHRKMQESANKLEEEVK
jgi:hypothetical protein